MRAELSARGLILTAAVLVLTALGILLDPPAVPPSAATIPADPQPTPSSTPFLPLHATDRPGPTPTAAPSAQQAPQLSTSSRPSAPEFYGIDLSPTGERVTLEIFPSNSAFNRGQTISISFYPGKTCVFGDHHACVNTYRAPSGNEVPFLSIHSGVGGEAQALRHALEGTGINQAGLSLRQISANLRALTGAGVRLTQGSRVVSGLRLAFTGRVPAAVLQNYFETPVERALTQAARYDSALQPALDPSDPELAFETCGWKTSEEPWAPGVSSTTASVYLGVIRKDP